jgi:hypothetical protein
MAEFVFSDSSTSDASDTSTSDTNDETSPTSLRVSTASFDITTAFEEKKQKETIKLKKLKLKKLASPKKKEKPNKSEDVSSENSEELKATLVVRRTFRCY